MKQFVISQFQSNRSLADPETTKRLRTDAADALCMLRNIQKNGV